MGVAAIARISCCRLAIDTHRVCFVEHVVGCIVHASETISHGVLTAQVHLHACMKSILVQRDYMCLVLGDNDIAYVSM